MPAAAALERERERERRSHSFLHVILSKLPLQPTENIVSKNDNINAAAAAARATVASSIASCLSVYKLW